jgi:hypothetical protein
MSSSVRRIGLAALALTLALVLAPVAGGAPPEGGNGNSASAPGQQKQEQPQPGAPGQEKGSQAEAPPRGQGDASASKQGKSDGRGANQSGPYDPSGVGEPSGNGKSEDNNGKRPCAGCVGKADAKNPPGQLPGGSDANRGYECDENQGVGKTNPAHSGCGAKAGGPPPPSPPHEQRPPHEGGQPSGGPPSLVPISKIAPRQGGVVGVQEEGQPQEQPGPIVGKVERRGGPEAPANEERGEAAPIAQLPFTGGALLILAACGLLALAGGLGVQTLVRGRLQG